MTDEQIQISKDNELMVQVISLIASYAIENKMSPDETIKTVAEKMLSLLKIATFENWGKSEVVKMDKTYRECAIEHLKQGNLCKGYVDYILDEMTKLEQIEEIVNAWTSDASHSFSDMCKINKIIKQE